MRRTAISAATAAITLAAATLTATGAHASLPRRQRPTRLRAREHRHGPVGRLLESSRTDAGCGASRRTTGQDACATYSPDGHSIAWCTTRGNTHGGADIWVMKQNGTDKRQVTHMSGVAIFPE